jgi:hypothetical protein
VVEFDQKIDEIKTILETGQHYPRFDALAWDVMSQLLKILRMYSRVIKGNCRYCRISSSDGCGEVWCSRYGGPEGCGEGHPKWQPKYK